MRSYANIAKTCTELESFRHSEKCLKTRHAMLRVQQLVQKLKSMGGTIAQIRMCNLSQEKIQNLVEEIEILKDSGVVFPQEVDKMVLLLLSMVRSTVEKKLKLISIEIHVVCEST